MCALCSEISFNKPAMVSSQKIVLEKLQKYFRFVVTLKLNAITGLGLDCYGPETHSGFFFINIYISLYFSVLTFFENNLSHS